MDLLLVLLSATVLTALGLVADRVGGDLRGGYRAEGRIDRTVDGNRPMRLDLLTHSPEEFARVGLAGAEGAARVVLPARAGAARVTPRRPDRARPPEVVGA